MHPHAQIIETFYDAFKRRDAEAMSACYHAEIHFSDPVFPDLRGSRAGDMWRMLCARKDSDLVISYSDVRAEGDTGSVHWEAHYTFPEPKRGRPVHNRVDASFVFRDGKIVRHIDNFDLWSWTRMAMGPAGALLGWTPFFQNTVRKKAAARLDGFVQR